MRCSAVRRAVSRVKLLTSGTPTRPHHKHRLRIAGVLSSLKVSQSQLSNARNWSSAHRWGRRAGCRTQWTPGTRGARSRRSWGQRSPSSRSTRSLPPHSCCVLVGQPQDWTRSRIRTRRQLRTGRAWAWGRSPPRRCTRRRARTRPLGPPMPTTRPVSCPVHERAFCSSGVLFCNVSGFELSSELIAASGGPSAAPALKTSFTRMLVFNSNYFS